MNTEIKNNDDDAITIIEATKLSIELYKLIQNRSEEFEKGLAFQFTTVALMLQTIISSGAVETAVHENSQKAGTDFIDMNLANLKEGCLLVFSKFYSKGANAANLMQ